MKKVILLAIMAMVTAPILQAQYRSQPKSSRMGIRFGGNINKIVSTGDGKTESGDGLLAFHLALTADFRLAGNLYLSTGAWYITKGDAHEYDGWGDDSKYKSISSLSYIEAPLVASYIHPVSNKFRLRADIGGFVAYGVTGKYKSVEIKSSGLLAGIFETGEELGDPFKKEDGDDYADVKRLDYGIRFGGALELGKFTMGVGYDFGLANILDGDPEFFKHHDYKSSTRSLLITLGFNF